MAEQDDELREWRRQMKQSARARRQQDGRRRGERRAWGRLWREDWLPREAVGEQEEDGDEALDARPAEVAQRKRIAEEDIDPGSIDTPLRTGMVLGLHSRGCRILADGEEMDGVLRQHIHVQQKSAIAPGDRVEFHVANDLAVVENVLPAESVLCRPDPTNPGIVRVVAANVELAVIVASTCDPALTPNLIDRYLIALERGEIEPLVCINKMDLVEAWPEEMRPYEDLGIRVIGCSAATGDNMDALGEAIAGKLCVFVGHSGTGKSSLLNTLQPGLNLKTRAVRDHSGKGRHATVTARLYELDNGARVIDTPGIREFGMWRMEPDELRWHFPEFESAPPCRFNDCTHSHEPGCGIKAAVEDGAISLARYESYLRILATL